MEVKEKGGAGMGRRIVLIVLFLLLVTIPVTAQSAVEDGADYDALLEDSGANDLAQSLPKETRDLLNQLGQIGRAHV